MTHWNPESCWLAASGRPNSSSSAFLRRMIIFTPSRKEEPAAICDELIETNDLAVAESVLRRSCDAVSEEKLFVQETAGLDIRRDFTTPTTPP